MWGAALSIEQAAAYVSLSVSTIEELVRKGNHPKPRQLSPRRAAFLRSEIDEWLLKRPVCDMLPVARSRQSTE